MEEQKNVSIIDAPEFINLQPLDINPLMSKCEVKVFYLGENRNHSFISKDTALEMAKTLRGAPIVGYYKEEKQDFADHGERVIIDGDGISFECMTKPYGFISPNAEVWFQKFEEIDDFQQPIVREYLMTTGYLWTGQFPECAPVVNSGKPQSMELDDETMEGHWATNQAGIEYFIINDATFSKLCILGDDVEPCFEGASVTAPQVSLSFTKKVDDKFKKTLFTMMQELKLALDKGEEEKMPEVSFEELKNQYALLEEQFNQLKASNDELNANFTALKEDNEALKAAMADYEALKIAHNQLQEQATAFEQENVNLKEFKLKIEDKEKDDMINSFYMLSDEDKKDVIENKANYTVDEIESKLSVICVRKKVNFDLNEVDKNDNNKKDAILTYNLQEDVNTDPAWVTAIKNKRK